MLKAFIITIILVLSVGCCLELYWRNRGFIPTFNDDKVLWAVKRKEIYKPIDEATVFIGGSRIKFDLDIPTWEKLTGEKAIQLAIVATPARLILRDLANDKNFRGKLVIDVAEPQFFTLDSMRRDRFAREALAYYYGETPAQRLSASINYFLEARLVALEESKFGLTALLNDFGLPNRSGVFSLPPFPKEFGVSSFDRQTFLTPMFMNDVRLQQWQIENWKRVGIMSKAPSMKRDALEIFLDQFKEAIDKIKSRGGQVIFVRPPSSGGFLEMEKATYPRPAYWEVLLKYTGTPGIHYSDYAETSHFVCPEWSHLSPQDAATYTQQLVKILQEEKGWKFSKSGK